MHPEYYRAKAEECCRMQLHCVLPDSTGKAGSFMPMDSLGGLRSFGRVVRFRPRDRIYSKGEPAREVFILKSGQAANSLLSADGHELVLQRVSPGEIVPITALLGDSVYRTDLIALTECDIVCLEVVVARKAMQADATLSFHVLELALKRLRLRSEQLTDAAFLSVRSRVCKWLIQRAAERPLDDPDKMIDLDGSERLLGLVLGVSRESINRQLSALVKAQVICRSGKRILIRDATKLREMMDAAKPQTSETQYPASQANGRFP